MNVSNKTCIYVGAFGGIGFAFCKRLLAKKIKALTVLDLKMNEKMFKELKECAPKTCIKFMEFDLLDKKDKITRKIQDAGCDLGQLDILVNGGGIVQDSKVDETIGTNLTGLIHSTKAAWPLMSKQNGKKGGMMVHIASILGLVYAPHICVYTGTKHGVIGFHRGVSDKFYFDLSGIYHIAICPGYTTDTVIWDNFEDKAQLKKQATFDFSLPLIEGVKDFKTQTADECAIHMLDAMENGHNGGIYIIDQNKMKQICIPDYLPI